MPGLIDFGGTYGFPPGRPNYPNGGPGSLSYVPPEKPFYWPAVDSIARAALRRPQDVEEKLFGLLGMSVGLPDGKEAGLVVNESEAKWPLDQLEEGRKSARRVERLTERISRFSRAAADISDDEDAEEGDY